MHSLEWRTYQSAHLLVFVSKFILDSTFQNVIDITTFRVIHHNSNGLFCISCHHESLVIDYVCQSKPHSTKAIKFCAVSEVGIPHDYTLEINFFLDKLDLFPMLYSYCEYNWNRLSR